MSEPLIVVPLDGSDLSEAAVPYAGAVARAMDARLLLVAVRERAEQSPVADLAEDVLKRGEQRYQGHLDGVAKKLESQGLETETELRVGHPVEEVLHVLEERDPRLLVMATHGRSGLSRWWYGSVASALVRQAPVPTMIAGPKVLERGAPDGVIDGILVPLDGSPLAESALQPAVALAERLGASLVLAQVVRWARQTYALGVPDVDVAEIDRQLTAAAEEYLARAKEGLRTECQVEAQVLHGAPADALIGLVEAEGIDLVVMASHARSGVARATLGSVADRMLQGKAPVLLIRPEAAGAVAHSSRGRYCHNCGRAVPYLGVIEDDRCLGCGQHLRACLNCVYHDGVGCLLERPEAHHTYPGRDCSYFQFRERPAPAGSGDK